MGAGNTNIAPTNAAQPINAKKPASAQNVGGAPEGAVTPKISGGAEQQPIGHVAHKEISREEKIEYRDQDGNLLNEEQVAALVGKVSFSTKYETRTRLVDADGNEVEGSALPVAPPHPDVEGAEPETVPRDEEVRSEKKTPSSEDVASDEIKEASAESSAESFAEEAAPEAEPASET
jgi:dolichyl-phosphate-mannose-protein mannosyltransferase